MAYRSLVLLLCMLVASLTGCGGMPPSEHDIFEEAEPVDYYPETAALAPTGSIYFDAGPSMVLFEDVKARQVGDILTVVLSESTDAAKSSDTSLDKSSSTAIENPLLAGKLRDFGDDNTLGFDLSSENGFEGESASNQRNSLRGSITVTVDRVLPGGNLYIKGEKWIQINQGNEYIRLQGVVRPVDVSAGNTVLSTKVADARISYGGTGSTADVNRVGWLSRFFISPYWPF
ncbi:MAG: flagellar basal body L-ring protein FlgH [Gammaproteobacteria bacterium]|jgi:flagellar L-ring protein precursor FlgH|nr:flagellar basal body L-ring protein FlgH [Gammaproteobacteria bacterium]